MELSSKYVTVVGVQPSEFVSQETKETVKGFYLHCVFPGNKHMQGYRISKPLFVSLNRANKYGLPSVGSYITIFYNAYKKIEGWQFEDLEVE